MKPEAQKRLIADLNARHSLCEFLEQAPAWRSALPPGDERKEDEAERLAKVNGAHAQLEAVEERINEHTSVSLLRFMRANGHVIKF